MFQAILKSSVQDIEFFLQAGCDPDIYMDLYIDEFNIKKKIGTIDIILRYYHYRPDEEWTQILNLFIDHGVSLDYTFYKDFQEKVNDKIQKRIYFLKRNSHLLGLV
jgi:hypothetical protein